MKVAIFASILLFACLVSGAPTTKNDDVVVTSEFFPEAFAVYTADHEIVSLLAPINALNLGDDTDDEEDNDGDDTAILFFALADVSPNGDRTDQGLYILKNKVATKLLDYGRDSTAELGDSKVVYFGAKDGLYKYNVQENKAEKYGSITDSIVQLVRTNGSDIFYILTEDKNIYKVTEEGTKKTKIEHVNNPKEIAMDFENNLYYFGDDKKPYVVNEDGAKKIEDIPENLKYAKLVRPAFVIENGLPFIADDRVYLIYPNGTSETTDFVLQVKPSAYSMDATLIQYYAYDQKIYEYNILGLILGSMLEEIRTYLEGFRNDIQSIATRSRSDLRA